MIYYDIILFTILKAGNGKYTNVIMYLHTYLVTYNAHLPIFALLCPILENNIGLLKTFFVS